MNQYLCPPTWCPLTDSFTSHHEMKLAFTFDDGPNQETTPILLDYLERNGIFAVFFEVGVNIKNQNLLKLVQSKGHIVASHTFEHMNMVTKSDEEIGESLEKVEDLIRSATGKRPFLMRAPYGSINNHVRQLLKEKEYLHVKWDIDSRDWDLEGDEARIVDNVESAIGRGGIVLMHEHPWTTQLQPHLISDLLQHNARFVTIAEFLTKEQKDWLCQQYECEQEMKDPESLFFKTCKYNLQCSYDNNDKHFL